MRNEKKGLFSIRLLAKTIISCQDYYIWFLIGLFAFTLAPLVSSHSGHTKYKLDQMSCLLKTLQQLLLRKKIHSPSFSSQDPI